MANRMRVKQCFYDPRYPGEKRKLPTVQPIHPSSFKGINVCELRTKNSTEYREVIIDKLQYMTMLGMYGSLKMKSNAGHYGSISFFNNAWDDEYRQKRDLRFGGMKAREFGAVESSTWTEMNEDEEILPAQTLSRTPEELKSEKDYQENIGKMDKAIIDGDDENASVFAKIALGIKSGSKKAKKVLENLAKKGSEDQGGKGLL